MKLLILILFPFLSFAQQSTYEQGDSTWVTSSDTGKVKVYREGRIVKVVNKKPKTVKDKHGNTFRLYEGLPYVGDASPYRFVDEIDSSWIDSLKAHGKTIHYTNKGNVVYKGDTTRKRTISIPDTTDPAWADSKTLHLTERGATIVDTTIKNTKEAPSIYDVYPITNPLQALESPMRCLFIPDKRKYDTIGPIWHLVSDTAVGLYNNVIAMQVYEVVVYKNEWIMVDPNIKSANGITTLLAPFRQEVLQPYHFAWLDNKKKSLKLKVW